MVYLFANSHPEVSNHLIATLSRVELTTSQLLVCYQASISVVFVVDANVVC